MDLTKEVENECSLSIMSLNPPCYSLLVRRAAMMCPVLTNRSGVHDTGGHIQMLEKEILSPPKTDGRCRVETQLTWKDTACGALDRGVRASPPNQLLISSFGTDTARSPKTAHQTAGLLYFIMAGANEREASLCSFQWLICVGKTPKLPCILPLINKLQYIINLSSKEGSSESFSQWEVLRQLTTFLKSNGFTCLFYLAIWLNYASVNVLILLQVEVNQVPPINSFVPL